MGLACLLSSAGSSSGVIILQMSRLQAVEFFDLWARLYLRVLMNLAGSLGLSVGKVEQVCTASRVAPCAHCQSVHCSVAALQ
jgi:hypothetical protein